MKNFLLIESTYGKVKNEEKVSKVELKYKYAQPNQERQILSRYPNLIHIGGPKYLAFNS